MGCTGQIHRARRTYLSELHVVFIGSCCMHHGTCRATSCAPTCCLPPGFLPFFNISWVFPKQVFIFLPSWLRVSAFHAPAGTTQTNLQAHGGSLVVYNASHSGPLQGQGFMGGEPATLVAPLGGRLVVFDSRLDHEVLPVHQHR